MEIPPATRLQILKAENRRLEGFLRDLPVERWEHPSPCAEWKIADVVAHLIAVARLFTDSVLKALQADGSAPATTVRTTNALMDARPLARAPIDLRRQLGANLFGAYIEANRALQAAFDQVGPGDWMNLGHRTFGPSRSGAFFRHSSSTRLSIAGM